MTDSAFQNYTPEEIDLVWYAHSYYTHMTGQHHHAIKLVKNYLRQADQIGDYFKTEDYHNLLGSAYIMIGKVDSATAYYILAAEILEKKGQFQYVAYVSNNIANIYMDDHDYQQALIYLKKSARMMRKTNDTTYLGLVYGNISQSYSELNVRDSTLKYVNLAKKLSKNTNNYSGYFNAQISEALTLLHQKDTSDAIEILKQNFVMADDKGNDKYKYITIHYLLPLIESNQQTLTWAEQSYNYFNNQHDRFRVASGETLAEEYFNNNQPQKAYILLDEIKTYSDSLADVDFQSAKQELLTKYESAQKDQQILKQQNLVSQKTLKNQQLNRAIWGTSILLIILIILIYFYRKNVQNKWALLKEKREKDVLKALILGEENERQRLAKDLHDGLANDIAALKLQIGMEAMKPDFQDKSRLTQWQNKLDQLHRSTKEISYNLLPKNILEDGLVKSLTALVNDYSLTSPANIKIKTLQYLENKNRSFDLFIYRIIQELLGNAIKHSRANNITIDIFDNGKSLTISVKDDGEGFILSIEEPKLSFLKERLHSMDGELNIETSSGKGTEIKIIANYDV